MSTVVKIRELQIHIHGKHLCEHSAPDPAPSPRESASSVINPLLEWSEPLRDGKLLTMKEADEAVAEMKDGWRLPTLRELLSIVDYDRHDPAIDLARFPNTKSEPFWTSSVPAWSKDARWVVYFYGGFVNVNLDNDRACVRACRASQSL